MKKSFKILFIGSHLISFIIASWRWTSSLIAGHDFVTLSSFEAIRVLNENNLHLSGVDSHIYYIFVILQPFVFMAIIVTTYLYYKQYKSHTKTRKGKLILGLAVLNIFLVTYSLILQHSSIEKFLISFF